VFPADERDSVETVVLPRLKGPRTLDGDDVGVVNEAPGDSSASSTDGDFRYARGDGHLVEANVYWHIDRFLEFVRGLGAPGLERRPVAHVNRAPFVGVCQGACAADGDLWFSAPLPGTSGYLYMNMGLAADVVSHETQHLVT